MWGRTRSFRLGEMCCLDVQNAPFEPLRKRCAVGVCTLSIRQGRVWGGFGSSNLAAIVNLNFFKTCDHAISTRPDLLLRSGHTQVDGGTGTAPSAGAPAPVEKKMLPSHSTDSVLEPRPDTGMRILQTNILHTGERDQTRQTTRKIGKRRILSRILI